MSLWKLRRIHWTGGERRRSTRHWWGLQGSTCVTCLAPIRRLRGCSHGWGGCWTKEGWACQGRLCRCSCSWKTTWFCEHLFHFDSCICTLLFDKYKKGYNRRLIEYSHLVLGTRSAAKFEQVPSSIAYATLTSREQGLWESTQRYCILDISRKSANNVFGKNFLRVWHF